MYKDSILTSYKNCQLQLRTHVYSKLWQSVYLVKYSLPRWRVQSNSEAYATDKWALNINVLRKTQTSQAMQCRLLINSSFSLTSWYPSDQIKSISHQLLILNQLSWGLGQKTKDFKDDTYVKLVKTLLS